MIVSVRKTEENVKLSSSSNSISKKKLILLCFFSSTCSIFAKIVVKLKHLAHTNWGPLNLNLVDVCCLNLVDLDDDDDDDDDEHTLNWTDDYGVCLALSMCFFSAAPPESQEAA